MQLTSLGNIEISLSLQNKFAMTAFFMTQRLLSCKVQSLQTNTRVRHVYKKPLRRKLLAGFAFVTRKRRKREALSLTATMIQFPVIKK